MEFYDVIANRHSVRKFLEKEIEPEKLANIEKAAMKSPSAGNVQAYRIYVVRSQEAKQEMVTACSYQEFLAQAPALLVFCAQVQESGQKYGGRGEQLYSIQDATIAAAYAQLAATAEGLSSVWVGAIDSLEASRIIDAESYEVPVAVIAVGYPAEEPEITGRRPAEEIIKEV